MDACQRLYGVRQGTAERLLTCAQTLCFLGFARVIRKESRKNWKSYPGNFGIRARRQGPFVDKPGSGGHNEKASLELESRLVWGFHHSTRARVAELADALASGASDRKVVEVRVLSRAPIKLINSSGEVCGALMKQEVSPSTVLFSSYKRPVQKRKSTINIISPTPLIG
jgi:hypothetical protein